MTTADQHEPLSSKAVEGLLRDARSLFRRADKLAADITDSDDAIAQGLAVETRQCAEQLMRRLAVVNVQHKRSRKAATRRKR